MKNPKLQETVLLLATAALLLLPLTLLGYYIVHKHHWAQERLAELEPRYSRLLGLQEHKAELEAALERARALRSQYIFPPEQDATQAGNAAQQKVRDIFTAAGLQILSIQVLAPKTEKGFERIPLSVRAEGEILALQTALAVLSSQTPIIVVNDLDVHLTNAGATPTAPPRLSANFSLSVLRGAS